MIREYVGQLSAAGKRVPWWVWLVALGLLGVAFLVWHQYAQDEADTDWTTPKETQPPLVAAFSPGQHGTGAPMACSPAFRGRGYPGTVFEVDGSILGGLN